MKNWSERKINFLNLSVFGGVILFFVLRIFLSSGELRPDSIQYLLQAQNFWDYKVNFPLGYAFFIKSLNLIIESYFVASKIINLLSYLAIIAFSYRKNFFFQQTLLVFSFYPFVNLYTLSLSEPLYFLINYLIIYCIYRIIETGFHKKYIFSIGILFFFLTAIRFSGVFVFVTSILFLGFVTYRKRYSIRSYLLFVLSSATGVFSYLLINYFYCGKAFGERNHLQNHPSNFINFISELGTSVLHDFSFLNIFIHKGILAQISSLHVYISIIIIFFTIFLLIKRSKRNLFNDYLIFSFLVIMISLVYSYYTTKIDDTIRVKSNAYLYLLFFISLNIPKVVINYFKVFVIFALVINSFTLIKYSGKITDQIKRNNKLICNTKDKKINIVYPQKDKTIKSNAQILLFKALLIDKGYKIYESDYHRQKVSDCDIKTSDIIK
jgi:hypothetical protein